MGTLVVNPIDVAVDFAALRKSLNSKQSFEAVMRQCTKAVQDSPACVQSAEFKLLLARAVTVLKSRFSASQTALWQAGLGLVRASAAANTDPSYSSELRQYEAQCLVVLGTEDETAGNAAAPPRTTSNSLFEGQLSAADLSPQRANQAPGLQDLAALFLGEQLMNQARQAEENTSSGGNVTTSSEATHDPPAGGTAGLAPEITPEMAEALQAELDAALIAMMEESAQQAPRPPPPASSAVVRGLPREKVTAAKLADLGGDDARCPVCMCLDEGDEIVVLPCKHWAHAECLAPWLKDTNTCPTCRHELPTDDQEYERRKEREKIEAEERKGAQNALSHNEFLYI